jgi:ABC-type sugar transport system permease subunit
MPAAKRASKVALRLFMAHGLAYPIATAWAFASVPLFVLSVASEVGITLDDQTVAHRVLLRVAWPAIGSFVLVHLVGVLWAFDPDEVRGRRVFRVALLALAAVAVVVGGITWIWLMTR